VSKIPKTIAARSREEARQNMFLHARILGAFLLIVAVLVSNGFFIFRGIAEQRTRGALVVHTHEVLKEGQDIQIAVLDGDVAVRGYVMTGNKAFLTHYVRARSEVPRRIAHLTQLTANSAEQNARVVTFGEQVQTTFNELQATVEARDTNGSAAGVSGTAGVSGISGVATNTLTGNVVSDSAAGNVVLAPAMLKRIDDAKVRLDILRSSLRTIRDEEERLLRERTETTQLSDKEVSRAISLAFVLNLALALFGYILFSRGSVSTRATTWFKDRRAELGALLAGDQPLDVFGTKVLDFLDAHAKASASALYVAENGRLKLRSAHGLPANLADREYAFGEGLPGKAVLERRLMALDSVPPSYFRIESAMGSATPTSLVLLPVFFHGEVQGVVELAAFRPFDSRILSLLNDAAEVIGTSLHSVRSRARLQTLLEETQTQQEELQQSNEELAQQTHALTLQREKLQLQQEELRQTNEELEQQSGALEMQKNILARTNANLLELKDDLEEKAAALERASEYKSEFLANMSHELRTPLNSLLILATVLAENRKAHLDAEELDFVRTIHASGEDLLLLINDILDLAKVEAGKLDILVEDTDAREVTASLDRVFAPLAVRKGVAWITRCDTDARLPFSTDRQRVEQILRNFLSNAFKFTERGSVTLSYAREGDAIVFSVEDTGIGIPADKLEAVFEAFQQADGATTRRFGGTGLGLTISRELARLLGGRILVKSELGHGSRFSLVLPVDIHQDGLESPTPATAPLGRTRPAQISTTTAATSLSVSSQGVSRTVLIVEDDPEFMSTLSAVAREQGFNVTQATSGERCLSVVREEPPSAVLLDVKLPGMSGLSVLERIKSDPRTRHLPVHMISGTDYSHNALRVGAMGYLVKPVTLDKLREAFHRISDILSRDVKRVLVVEDDSAQRDGIRLLINGRGIETVCVGMGAEAKQKLASSTFDCMILDLRLPDMTGFELLEAMEHDETLSHPPVVVYTGRDLTRDEEARLRRHSESIIVKGARSPERLLDEVGLFLHKVEEDLRPEAGGPLGMALSSNRKSNDDLTLQGRHVLLADDDLRNTFALIAALEPLGIRISVARNGLEALEAVRDDASIELVLMDIMMPEMDGYEAITAVRALPEPRFEILPIIALTAKAMKADKERCFEVGATDYLAKPIVVDDLLSLLRVWLPAAARGN